MQSRITITIPGELVKAADERAKAVGRSRSWVLVEALRRYLQAPVAPGAVRGPATHPYVARQAPGTTVPVDAAAEVAASRRRRLRAELALPVIERLRRAEEIARLGGVATLPRAGAQIVAFDTYEDYYGWKRNRLIRA